jgi:hypothetical protein
VHSEVVSVIKIKNKVAELIRGILFAGTVNEFG